jgi:hypothetical protein
LTLDTLFFVGLYPLDCRPVRILFEWASLPLQGNLPRWGTQTSLDNTAAPKIPPQGATLCTPRKASRRVSTRQTRVSAPQGTQLASPARMIQRASST